LERETVRRRSLELLVLFLLAGVTIYDGVRIVIRGRALSAAGGLSSYMALGAGQAGVYLAFLGGLLACLSIIYFWIGIRTDGRKSSFERRAEEGIQWVLIAFAILAAYVLIMGSLGYMLSTALFLVVFFKVFGSYRWLPSLLGALAIAVGSAYFWATLGMMLPQGIIPWP
jgi:hypothetical protein